MKKIILLVLITLTLCLGCKNDSLNSKENAEAKIFVGGVEDTPNISKPSSNSSGIKFIHNITLAEGTDCYAEITYFIENVICDLHEQNESKEVISFLESLSEDMNQIFIETMKSLEENQIKE